MATSQSDVKATGITLPDTSVVTKNILEKLHSESGKSLSDVTLISSDGVRMPALRLLLSMCSSYFENLFSADFAEKNSSQVNVSIESSLLREILDFIHTDDCDRLRTIRERAKESLVINCRHVRALIELGGAADYTRVEPLVTRCEEAVKYVMLRSPHTACTTVLALARERLSWGAKLFREAEQVIMKSLEESLLLKYDGCDLRCGIMHFDSQGAQDLFSSLTTETSEQRKLFQALIVWATKGTALLGEKRNPLWTDTEIDIDTENIKVVDDRLETAELIATWFDVSSFKPGFISNVVESSGLVGQNELYIAYRKQSIQLEKHAKRKTIVISGIIPELIKAINYRLSTGALIQELTKANI